VSSNIAARLVVKRIIVVRATMSQANAAAKKILVEKNASIVAHMAALIIFCV
jgi:cytochrome c biogenesis protein ResB